MAELRITQINIYPIKSTARISLSASRVLQAGLELDRRWLLVRPDGEAITAREYPLLTLVRTKLDDDTLVVVAAGMPELRIRYQQETGALRAVRIWGEECTAGTVGAQAERWFSNYLHEACELVRMSDTHPRPVDPDYARPGDYVSFADAFPLLLISEASLADLNERVPHRVSMRRFRPNLVVNGEQPYAEDHWKKIRIGTVVFDGVKNCSRCVFTTIDPETGTKDSDLQPLRTLGSYRRRPGGGVFFGQNLIPRTGGTVQLNDAVEILA